MAEIEITKSTTHNGFSIPGVKSKAAPLVNPDMELIDARLINGTDREKDLIRFLKSYDETMKDANVDETIGYNNQISLYRQYLKIINDTDATEFRTLWSILLLFANIHKKSSFRSDMINRFSYLWTLGQSKLAAFGMVNNLVLLTMDPTTRAINLRRQIDFGKVLDPYFDPEVVQKVLGYYKS